MKTKPDNPDAPAASLKRVVRRFRVRVVWKLEDLWVGVFWKQHWHMGNDGMYSPAIKIWVCVVPCLPIYILTWREPSPDDQAQR